MTSRPSCELKRERNAVILAHNYMTPEIFHGVADFVGDSLALAREAATHRRRRHRPGRRALHGRDREDPHPGQDRADPRPAAGCSLAASITGADVRLIEQRYPGVPVVTYVNTTAEVKAETDICCTSANAVQVVESLGRAARDLAARRVPGPQRRRPDRVEIIAWKGRCEVHERFTADGHPRAARGHPGVEVLAHPECPPEVLAEADFAGSTAAMTDYVGERRPKRVVLVTECSMGDNVAAANPDIEFVRPCNLCPHMKRITLPNIRRALRDGRHEVTVDPAVAERARLAVERMLAVAPRVRRWSDHASSIDARPRRSGRGRRRRAGLAAAPAPRAAAGDRC